MVPGDAERFVRVRASWRTTASPLRRTARSRAIEPFPALTVSPERLHEDMTAQLTNFVAGVDTSGAQTQIRARSGSPARGILDEAAATHSDLIVIGTHGHSGFDRLVLGSVTEKILRKAPCAVLTVPPPVAEPPADALDIFKRILCPVDFSDASMKALEYALALAKEADAELHGHARHRRASRTRQTGSSPQTPQSSSTSASARSTR